MNKISGIYKITNKVTGDFYIGSSKNIKHRWACHKSPARWAYRPGMKLYQAMAQYGLDSFIFEVIEETTMLKEREQYWISYLHPSYNNNRAMGWNSESRVKAARKWQKLHRDEFLAQKKEWQKAHQEEYITYQKEYKNQLCFYEGETLTLNALSIRFLKQNISNPTLEAKKYLVSDITN